MKGVFKITHAEFTKIFKKPIVYIMAFVLALTAVLSIVFFKPNVRSDNSVMLDADNAHGCYNIFYGTSDDSKRKYDETYLSAKQSTVVYTLLNDRDNRLDKALEEYNTKYALLETYNTNPTDSESVLIANTNTAIEGVLNTFVNISEFDSYDYLKELMGVSNGASEQYYKIHHIDTEKHYNYEKIKTTYENNLKSASNINSYINFIKTNKFGEILSTLVNYGKKLIYNNLLDIVDSIKNQQNTFIDLTVKSQTETMQQQSSVALENLNQQIKNFQNFIDLWVKADYLIILGTKNNYNNIKDVCENVMQTISYAKSPTTQQYTQAGKLECADALKKGNHIQKMQDYIKSLAFLSVSNSLIEEFNTISEKVTANQTTILNAISELKDETATSKILTEITNYKVLGETYADLIKQLVVKEYSKFVSVDKIRDCKSDTFSLADYNTYENNQNISRNKYQIDKNIYSNTLGNVFSFGTTSTYEKSVYDCIYFTLKICTILVIIFTIMMISGLVTSETENGTIKLLLIRPYRRSKILIGKMLATLFFSLIFILLSVVLSFTVGYFMYGLPAMSQIMVTFNATKTFLISPVLLILLFVISCILDVIFYLILSLTISVLFRSYIGAITTSFLIYVGSIVVSAFIPTSAVYAYLPFTNTSLFRYFGGELLGNITTKASLFICTPVQSYQSFLTSILITGITSIILFTTTLITFNRRDF